MGRAAVRDRRKVTKSPSSRIDLERSSIEGNRPVGERRAIFLDPTPKYCGTREILWEFGRTIS